MRLFASVVAAAFGLWASTVAAQASPPTDDARRGSEVEPAFETDANVRPHSPRGAPAPWRVPTPIADMPLRAREELGDGDATIRRACAMIRVNPLLRRSGRFECSLGHDAQGFGAISVRGRFARGAAIIGEHDRVALREFVRVLGLAHATEHGPIVIDVESYVSPEVDSCDRLRLRIASGEALPTCSGETCATRPSPAGRMEMTLQGGSGQRTLVCEDAPSSLGPEASRRGQEPEFHGTANDFLAALRSHFVGVYLREEFRSWGFEQEVARRTGRTRRGAGIVIHERDMRANETGVSRRRRFVLLVTPQRRVLNGRVGAR